MKPFKGAALVAAALMLAGVSVAVAAEDLYAGLKSGKADLVKIADGQVQGYEKDGVSLFLGIPYAAPPVGNLRWMPPAAPAKWDGVRDAGAFGKSCLQTSTFGVFAKQADSEDCLYVNVFAPDAAQRGTPRPVMVWVHGGGLINGRADDHDGRELVKKHGVVFVSFNYRINLFGYFAHPAIDKEGHPFGNYGTLDQQAALRWVKANIRAFGGDPGNVTLFGESAGGLAILFNMVSPGADGLYHKVILHSGVSASPQTPVDAAEKAGIAFGEDVGCADQSAQCLRSKTVADILGNDKAKAHTGRSTRVVDGTVLPGQLQTLFAEGKFHRVPILMGNNHDEWTWFVSFAEVASGKSVAKEDYEKNLAATYGAERAKKIVAEYPIEKYNSASEAISEGGTARNFYCPSLKIAESAAKHVPVYFYEFMDRKAPFYFPAVSYPYGAAHTLDIQYIFPRYHGAAGDLKPLDASQQKLADSMKAYWANFAKTGDPNGAGVPAWPKWSASNMQMQLLDPAGIKTAKDAGIDRKCGFWNSL